MRERGREKRREREREGEREGEGDRSIPPEKVFGCFQGVSKEISGMKWVNIDINRKIS